MEGRIPDISDRIYRAEVIKEAYEPDISRPLAVQWKTDSRTRFIVCFADSRAFVEPRSRTSSTRLGCCSWSSRRARMGSIHLMRFSAMAALHSMQPMPALVQPLRTHSRRPGSRTGVEKSLCQSYTGQTSGLPGSVRRLRAGSVTMALVLARMSASDSERVIALP